MTEPRRLRAVDLILALLSAVLLYGAWMIRGMLLLIYVSIIFAIVLTPAVHAISRVQIRNWKPSHGAAVLILAALVVLAIGIFAFLALPPIIQDVQQLTQNLPSRLDQVSQQVRRLPLGNQIASILTPQNLQQYLTRLVDNIFGTLQAFAMGITNLALLVILTAYFVLDGCRAFDWALSLVPANQRPRLRRTMIRGGRRVQRWIVGQLLLMLILGGYSFVLFLILDVRYFYALAVFAGVANIIPILGPVISVILAGVVAAIDSWTKLLGVLIGYLIYQQVENAYLSPRIMESTVKIPAVTVIVALAIGGALAGILGALVAVPSAGLIATVIDEYLVNREQRQPELRKAS